MNTHFAGTHFASTHFASTHFARDIENVGGGSGHEDVGNAPPRVILPSRSQQPEKPLEQQHTEILAIAMLLAVYFDNE